MNLQSQSIDRTILRNIRASRTARVFSVRDFSGSGSAEAVRQALSRMVRSGKIRRVRRGLYDLPRRHPITGQTAPDIQATVRTLMAGSLSVWQFSGAYAANLLGLSEQVPAKVVILTNGAPRRVMLGKIVIEFRRVAPRNLLGGRTLAGLVFQALRYLRFSENTPRHIARLKRQLPPQAKARLKTLLPKMPAWMQPVVQQIIS